MDRKSAIEMTKITSKRGNQFDLITGTGILKTGRAVIQMGGTEKGTFENKAQRTIIKLKDPDNKVSAGEESELEIVPWGEDNNEPQKIITAIESIGIAGRAVDFNIKSLYGQGPFLYRLEYDEDGKENIKPINPTDKERKGLIDFVEKSRLNKASLEFITDLEFFFNVFPEYIVSRDFKTITSVHHQESAFCRWALWDEKLKRIAKCAISSSWDDPAKSVEAQIVDVADPKWTVDETRAWCKKNKVYKFIYPANYPTPGKSYYKKPYWNGARKAGWFDLAAKVPEFKSTLMENQISIRWVVKIPWDYWDKEFPQSQYTNDKDRMTLISERLDEIEDFITGAKNAGKALISHFDVDRMTQKALPGITIEPITRKSEGKDGEYLEDSSAANSEILFSFGVDGTLIGAGTPGGKREGGGGSDKREALLIKGALHKPGRDLISEIWEFAFKWNKYGEGIRVGFKDMNLTTLDKNPTGSEKVITS